MRRRNSARPIEAISKDGSVIVYTSIIDAGLAIGVSSGTIHYYLKKYPQIYHGYQWRHKDQDVPGSLWTTHPTLPIQCSEDGRIKFPSGRITKGCLQCGGRGPSDMYYYIGTEGKYYKVHRLIAQTFIPNPENKPTVDHIDRDGLNNHISNLRWATISEQNLNRSSFNRYMRRIKKK